MGPSWLWGKGRSHYPALFHPRLKACPAGTGTITGKLFRAREPPSRIDWSEEGRQVRSTVPDLWFIIVGELA